MEFKSGIRQRGERFEFTISLGFDGNGKHIRKYGSFTPPKGLTERQLKKAVEAAYDEFKERVNGNKSLRENMRLSQLGEMYFAEYAPNCLKKVTAYTYEGSYRKNIQPVLGNVRLKDLNTSMITDFLLTLGKDKKPQTVRKNKIILHSILNYAVSQKFIKDNPCVGTIWKRDVEGSSREITNYLTEDEAKTLMRLTEDYSPFNTIVRLLLLTGMRSGEALGLTWDRVDFKSNTLFIDKTLTYTTGHYFLSTPKTEMSLRTIQMDDATAEMLKRHKREQDKLKAIVGAAWQNPNAVFTSATGHYYDRCLLNTQFRRFLGKHTELPKITIHGLRHTNASLLIRAGENLDAISKHLGHASADITSRVYSHMLASVRVRISKTLTDILY